VINRRIHAIAGLFGIFSVLAVTVPSFRYALEAALYPLIDLSFYNHSPYSLAPPVAATRVAHAGGAVRGLTYTNSREALEEHYARGYRVFELDFGWTSDDRLVLIHDWAGTSAQFGTSPHVFSRAEFVAGKRIDGLHQLTFEDLCAWLRAHPDALVVTDTKQRHQRLLHFLRRSGSAVLPQLIIQIYWLSELPAARQLRPRAVWLSVSTCPAWAVSRLTGVDAFVIAAAAYAKYYQPQLMARSHFYVHSIAEESVPQTARAMPGIYGFYVN
jgi:glycerophosphoryl diester phosphodiesterase